MQQLFAAASATAQPGDDADTRLATLANGVRVAVIRLPHLESASVSVFVRTGSQNESARQNGISHFVEHMAFKGTHERDCQRINLDAERLGAEVNAHTDKDHTAFHMRGLARDAGAFVSMLGDIVRNSSFPEAELERERQVILHEYAEEEDDALATAYKLFDKTCFGSHPIAQPVIGTRRNIERIARVDLLRHVQTQYGADNLVVGVAGNVDPERVLKDVEAAFGTMAAAHAGPVEPPQHLGGVHSARQTGCSQTHLVLGFPLPALGADDPAGSVAATLFGEGMSSPLMDQIRERRGLAYYAACSADVTPACGQFVIEASTTLEQLDELLVEVMRLLHAQAAQIDPVDLERARNQIVVRLLHAAERPYRRLEDAAQDLFAFGRVRPREEVRARIDRVSADDVRSEFQRLLGLRAGVAIAGKIGKGCNERVLAHLAAAH